jgi:hypothetical protein
MVNKRSGAKTPIREENGHFAMYIWVKDPEVNSCSVAQDTVKQVATSNRFSALEVSEEGFARPEDPF